MRKLIGGVVIVVLVVGEEQAANKHPSANRATDGANFFIVGLFS